MDRQQQQVDDWEDGDVEAAQPAQLRPVARPFVPPYGGAPTFQQPAWAQKDQDDDEWFGSRRPVSNRQIWDSANAAPPPAVITPTPSYGAYSIGTPSTSQLPPPPKMQILKRQPQDGGRPTSRSSSAQGGTPGNQVKSMEKREEDYRKARERIFGSSGGEPASRSGSQGGSKRSTPTSTGPSSPAAGGYGSPQTGPRGSAPNDLRLVPSQIRRSPAGSRSSTPDGWMPGAGRGGGGLVRQPRGPGEGGGFVGR